MSARDYIGVFRDGWIVILVCVAVATGIAVIHSSSIRPTYEATSILTVSACIVVENSDDCDPLGGIGAAIQRGRVYVAGSTSAPVLDAARATLEPEIAGQLDAGSVSAVQQADSPIVMVSARANDPQAAAAMSTAVANAIIEYASETVDGFDSGVASVDLRVTRSASPPESPIAEAQNFVQIAVVLGLVVGVGIAFALYFSNNRLRSRSEAEAISGVDVLAELPLNGRGGSPAPAVVTTSAEGFQHLRAATLMRSTGSSSNVLLVTSARSEQLTSHTARGLATSIADAGHRVALIEVRGETDSSTSPAKGLSDLVNGKAAIAETLQPIEGSRAVMIPRGTDREDSSSVLLSPQLEAVIVSLREQFDFIVLNAPGVLSTADVVSAAHSVDNALVVASVGVTSRSDLADAFRALSIVSISTIGVALIVRASTARRR